MSRVSLDGHVNEELHLNSTNQWSLLRLGGAVQSFKGRRGLQQAPPLTESNTNSMATTDSRSIGAGLKNKGEPSHGWKAV